MSWSCPPFFSPLPRLGGWERGRLLPLPPAWRVGEGERDGDCDPVIELRHVNVAYDGHFILNDISWTVRTGERWAVRGPNGSGKSTLLSLLCGDHPQAYANDVRLFGQRRGSGESIWDVKRRTGFVSPELHLYFSGALSDLASRGHRLLRRAGAAAHLAATR